MFTPIYTEDQMLQAYKKIPTHFRPDGDPNDHRDGNVVELSFASREFGSVADCEAGMQDVREGRRFAKLLKEVLPLANVEMEIVDEWVIVSVNNGPKVYASALLVEIMRKALNLTESDKIQLHGGYQEGAIFGNLMLISNREGLFVATGNPWKEENRTPIENLEVETVRSALEKLKTLA